MTNFLIDTDIKLQNITKDLANSKYIGLDTEFIRESTYYPNLALLQLSDEKNNYCIDILQIKENYLITNILSNGNIKKIMHSSKQDLEVLNHYFNCYPVNIFDTQIAYNLLYSDMNISYSNLVKKYFDVDLKEGSWRTDWLKRPISDDKLEYAANDVKYLIQLCEILTNELTIANRKEWFEEELNTDLSKQNIITEPSLSWEKINLPSNMQNFQLSNLKLLSEWREQKAISRNIPKRWIFSDSELIKLIMSKSARFNSVLENLKHKPNEKDLEFIRNSCMIDKEEKYVRMQELDLNLYNSTISNCHNTLSNICEKYKIASSLVANKRDIELFARGKKDIKFLYGWRFKIFGKLVQ